MVMCILFAPFSFFYQYLWLYSNLFMYSISRKYCQDTLCVCVRVCVSVYVLHFIHRIRFRTVLFGDIFIFIYIFRICVYRKNVKILWKYSFIHGGFCRLAYHIHRPKRNKHTRTHTIDLMWLFIYIELLTTLLRIILCKIYRPRIAKRPQ